MADKNKRLAAVLKGVAELNFGEFGDNQIDLFGDAYEFLISNYAANAGKSGGEFFTPQHVSKLVPGLVSHVLERHVAAAGTSNTNLNFGRGVVDRLTLVVCDGSTPAHKATNGHLILIDLGFEGDLDVGALLGLSSHELVIAVQALVPHLDGRVDCLLAVLPLAIADRVVGNMHGERVVDEHEVGSRNRVHVLTLLQVFLGLINLLNEVRLDSEVAFGPPHR